MRKINNTKSVIIPPPKTFDLENLKRRYTIGNERGYLYFYKPKHPIASGGKVYLHRLAASVKIGRWVTSEEAVYFVDGDKSNLSLDNLEVGPRGGAWGRRVTGHGKVRQICAHCGRSYYEYPAHAHRRKYCSPACSNAARRRFDVSPDELADLVWKYPMTKLAEMFGVSDKAIKKRCEKYGIQTPGRGYWQRLAAGQIDPHIDDD